MRIKVKLSLATGCLFVCLLASAVCAQPFERKWYLGVEAHPTTKGYLVRSVTPDSPAYEANLHRGDYINSVNGIEVGYIEKDKYYPLVVALNKSNGKAKLLVSFGTAAREWHKYETTVQLAERGKKIRPPHPLQLVVDPSKAKLSTDPEKIRVRDAKEAADVSQQPETSERDTKEPTGEDKRVNRDERGVVDESVFNPDLSSDDDETSSNDPAEQD